MCANDSKIGWKPIYNFERKKSTPKQRSYYSERHTLYLALSLFAPDLSITDNQGRRTAGRLFTLWGVVVTDQGGKVFCQSGVSGAQTRDFHHVIVKSNPFQWFNRKIIHIYDLFCPIYMYTAMHGWVCEGAGGAIPGEL